MKFQSIAFYALASIFLLSCTAQPYLKTNSIDAYNLPLDASLNVILEGDVPAKIDPIFVDLIKEAIKSNFTDRGNIISDQASLLVNISVSSEEFVRDDGNYYRYPYYYRSPYDLNRIRSIDEYYLRISIFDKAADKTLWTGLTRWRPGSVFEPSNVEKAENLVGLVLETI
tara:strand:+ start:294 stop:803 length:510 start_codon:yes stop_codon:yes gene_type:complete